MLDNALTRPVGSPAPSRDLPALRNRSAQVIVWIIWTHGPALLAAMACLRQWSGMAIALWAGLALTATLVQRSAPTAARTRLTLAAALCAMPGLLVLVLDGHPWQIDAHMHFFAVLAVVTTLLDWRSVIAGAGVVALHHLTLNLVIPEFVFPGGGDLARVLLHAGILTFEAAALAWLTHRAATVMTAASAAAEEILALTRANTAAEQQTRLAAAVAQRAAMNKTADAFEIKVGQLASVLSEDATALQTTAQSMSVSANQTNRQAALVAAAADEASARAQTAAVAADALSASITEISRQVAHSSTIADRAVSEARQTDATVRALSESAEEIGHVVRLIVTIAEQTNLLALNATIEAARAGHAGKGFAVVASEVKSLASQTSEATNGISAQITHVQSAIGHAVDAIRVITGTITEVRSVATVIAASIEEQGTATEEIARNVQRTAMAARDVTRNLEGVRQAANDTDAAADQVLGASGNVSERSVQLTTEVNGFVTDVRAA